MKYILSLFVLVQCSFHVNGQGIIWETTSWTNAFASAEANNKLIFVDFYTHWCGPCLEMDKEVFPQSTVGDLYNEHFISFKLNAEDNDIGTELAKQYNVKSYPTLLYFNSHGELLTSTIGKKNKYELIEKANQSLELNQHAVLINNAKENISINRSLEELKKILSVTRIHRFEGKEKLAMRYLDKIEHITEEDLRYVMGEIGLMDLSYVKRLAPLTTSLSYSEMYVRKNSKEWISWKTETERAVNDRLAEYKKNNNFEDYERTLEILRNFDGIRIRQIDNLYLDFYKQNNLDQYRTFATYVVQEYIIPTRPEDVKAADEKKYQLLQEEIAKDFAASSNSGFTSFGSDSNTETPTIDSLANIYTISKNIADQLYDISGDFFAFFEDEHSQRKVLFWASLTHLYYPYDWKYFDNHIFLLEHSGQQAEARQVLLKAQSLPWYDEMRRAKTSF